MTKNKCVRALCVGMAAVVISGCVTTGSSGHAGSTDGIELPAIPSFFTLFKQQGSELSALVDGGKYAEADAYFAKERDYFRENKNEHLPTLQKLATGLTASWSTELGQAIARLAATKDASPERWEEAKNTFAAAQKAYADVKNVELFNEPGFEPKQVKTLGVSLSSAKTSWENGAPDAFKGFDHFAGKSFFNQYPISLDGSLFLDKNVEVVTELVKGASAEQIVGFAKTYSAEISRSDVIRGILAEQYFAKQLDSMRKPVELVSVMEALKNSKRAGFAPKTIPGFKVGFAEATSQTLLKEGHIEFPAQVDMDMPFEPIKAEIDDLLVEKNQAAADFLVVFDVAKANNSRRVLTKVESDSKFVSGTRSEPNPSYDIARGKLMEAQVGLAKAQGTYTYGVAAAIVNAVAIGLWRSQVNEAEAALSSTPSTLQKDVYVDYKFHTSEVKAVRAMTTNYYVIDRVSKKYFKGSFDATETKTFKIAYNVHDKDSDRARILSQYDKEDDITRYEQAPMTVTASSLIEDYLKNATSAKPLPPLAKLRQEMLEDKNKALALHKAKQFDGKPLKDSRFDSVVVILNPKGALGSGFFVKPTLVLTNHHVVEGVKFVEMKMYNGMETFGKVVKSDVRLDLALIKVQDQGAPVQFFDGNTIDLGSTLEAIGHPRGLTFTITRGVASAVRKKKSVNAVGGKDVLFVQTDAAINPGNSGGPLFLGQQVVGVNNNKLAGGSEGLGFAVHYSEVAEFLKESF